MRSLKILQINSVCGQGSTGKVVVQISDYLNQQGVENYIAYGFGYTDRTNTFKFGNSIDAHLHSFMSRKMGLQGKMSHLTTLSLIKYIKKIKPSIIHLHNIHGHYLNYQMLFSFFNNYNGQVVWTFHDCWPITGKCVHFTEAKCEKWKSCCFECPQLDRYPDSERDRSYKSYLEKKAAFTSISNLHIVTVSNWLKSVVEDSYLSKADIRCIYNGIDTNMFLPTKSSIRDMYNLNGKFIILSVASVWNEGKGLKHFIELASRLRTDEVIVLVGIKSEQLKSLPSNIIGLPKTNGLQELVEWYSTADVYINFSIEETFGLVVAEAMSCGTPVIVMNSTACPEVVDSETGFVVNPFDFEGILENISYLKSRGKLDYSDKCRERIENLFSLQKMQELYWNTYLSIGGYNE